jgi:hypothetical protein
MCGYHFEGEAEDGLEQDSSQRKSRVRQRTISVSKDEMEDISQHVSAESDDFNENTSVLDSHEEELDFAGPQKEDPKDWDNKPVGLFADLEDAALEDAAEISSEYDGGTSDEDSLEHEFVKQDKAEVFFQLAEELEEDSEPKPVSSERALEQGSKLDKYEESDLVQPSFSDDADDGEEDSEDDGIDEIEDVYPDEGGAQRSEGPEQRPTSRRRRRRRKKKRPTTDVSIAVAADEEKKLVQFNEFQVLEKETEMATFESPRDESGFDRGISDESPIPSEAEASLALDEGALVGWLVNYDQDAKGVAGEIRSGKFFIGRQRLRKHDMVIGDSAISTPHCLMAASCSGGLVVQDLMSDQGTFIKKRGAGSFVKVQDSTKVEHGDCLRFGGYEVLVCLVPKTR